MPSPTRRGKAPAKRTASGRSWKHAMRMDQATLKAVGKIALALEGVEESLYFGGPAFKVNGHLLACPAGHPSAEMNSLLVPMPFDQRDELLAADPDAFYLKPHYQNFPVIVVRVARIHPDGLRDLLREVWHQAKAKKPRRPTRSTRPPRPT